EVVELTGDFKAVLGPPEPACRAVRIGLDLDTELLDQRIADRVDRMWRAGLVDEVRGLVGRGLRDGRTASRALGYQQVLRRLAGELTEEEARQETVRATRRFVRRQRSWFRRDRSVRWLDGARVDLLDAALEQIREATRAPAADRPGGV
ncbi:MAG: tRNA (adenosine(37)-N6)-dimethylallyltransferase MiaA, partial [Micromonosporaceae bacterium]